MQADSRVGGTSLLPLPFHQKSLEYDQGMAWHPLHPNHEWSNELSIEDWWAFMTCKAPSNRKAMASITLLTC
jgi:hypothetical protein